ncbi:hypothetical protein HHI36_000674 [Cryptolaemus montrouzieri]|uniref:Uncharacterized protein n=1 Tax=Cryptolaemus montrouzieri TaxID=559131 RepID=A0ABD2P5C3_9CUCU
MVILALLFLLHEVNVTVPAHPVPQPIPINVPHVPVSVPISIPSSIPPQQYVITSKIHYQIPEQVPLIMSTFLPSAPLPHVHHVTQQPMMLNITSGLSYNIDMVTPTGYSQIGDLTSSPIGSLPGSVSAQNISISSQGIPQNQNVAQQFQ